MTLRRRLPLALVLALSSASVIAAPLFVVDARGGTFKKGQEIDSARPITLKEGEQVTLVGGDGKRITLRGRFSGLPMSGVGGATVPTRPLSVLVGTGNSHSSTPGVVRSDRRSGLPQPWLIDVSTPGQRCLRPGQQPIYWRPEVGASQKFTLSSVDQSWRLDFEWLAGQHAIPAPPLAKFEGQTVFMIRMGEREYGITLNLVPTDLDGFALAKWMIQKGCIQQADALVRQMERGQAATK